jgi:hypothetical protein
LTFSNRFSDIEQGQGEAHMDLEVGPRFVGHALELTDMDESLRLPITMSPVNLAIRFTGDISRRFTA